jgi:uncharacterized OsmC-like protein
VPARGLPAAPGREIHCNRECALKITLLSGERLRIEGGAGPLTVEAESAEMSYSPFHMVASGLATCTFSVLHSWASNAGLPADDLAVEVGWAFVEDPHRVGRMDVAIDWPSLPEARRAAAGRAAGLCAVKKTLQMPPEITTGMKAS